MNDPQSQKEIEESKKELSKINEQLKLINYSFHNNCTLNESNHLQEDILLLKIRKSQLELTIKEKSMNDPQSQKEIEESEKEFSYPFFLLIVVFIICLLYISPHQDSSKKQHNKQSSIKDIPALLEREYKPVHKFYRFLFLYNPMAILLG